MKGADVSLWAQSLLFTAAGLNHFWHEQAYVRIMPEHYSRPAALVLLTGIAEIAGGVGLLPRRTRRPAVVGLTALLLIFLDVHVSMLRHADRFPQLPLWALWARIPGQFLLIAWVWRSARSSPES